MLRKIKKHTCNNDDDRTNQDHGENGGTKRQKNFAIKKEEIIPHIKVTVFKDPQITVPVLLNILEDSLGKLFAEENRSG